MLRSLFRTAVTILFAGSLSAPAWAEDGKSWALETYSGQVRLVKSGIVPIALTAGDVMAGGDWIETGPDGRVVLRRGAETIVVAPNSRIGLPKDPGATYATRIIQTLGTILLTVEKRAAQHFEVVTPYLTAVVKGTTFTVGIQGKRASVHVVEGLVEVTNLASGRASLIRPGQSGAVFGGGDANAGVRIEGGTTKAAAPVRNEAEVGAVPPASPASPAARAHSAAPAAPAAIVPVPAPVSSAPARVTIKQMLGAEAVNLADSTNGLLRNAAPANRAEGIDAAAAAVGPGIGQAPTPRPSTVATAGAAIWPDLAPSLTPIVRAVSGPSQSLVPNTSPVATRDVNLSKDLGAAQIPTVDSILGVR